MQYIVILGESIHLILSEQESQHVHSSYGYLQGENLPLQGDRPGDLVFYRVYRETGQDNRAFKL